MFEKEIAIIGPTEVVKPFLTLGLNCYEIQDSTQAGEIIQQIVREDKHGLILIAEGLAEKLLDQIEKIKMRQLPAVFILPEFGSTKQLGLKRLESVMARAIGKKI